MKVLEAHNITKRYNGVPVVSDLSFSVEGGEMFGLLGPNGAGKTTTIRIIMNIIYPDSGGISIFGERLTEKAKERIGYLPEERGMYKRMRVGELLAYFGMLKGKEKRVVRQRARDYLALFGMADCERKKIEDLSKGMQQKIQFLATILHDPDLILLDEPFSGLDPLNRKLIKDTMENLRKEGKTIIFSTHQMDEVERLCDDILLIDRGVRVLAGNLGEIKKTYGADSILLSYEGDLSFLRTLPAVASLNDYGKYAEIVLAKGASPQEILRALTEKVKVVRFEVGEPSLDRIFIDAVGGRRE